MSEDKTHEPKFDYDYQKKEEKPEQPQEIHTVDLSKLTPQAHLWVDRGQVMSCEGAGHASHRAFKRLR